MIKEKPILFSGEMVKAILAGTKKQTRRIIKIQPPDERFRIATLSETTDRSRKKLEGQHHWVIFDDAKKSIAADQDKYFKSPFGYNGDRLWVREAHRFSVFHTCGESGCECLDFEIEYEADHKRNFSFNMDGPNDENWGFDQNKLRPSIHMPRWASRINLEITIVKVERMQDGGDREFWGEEKWAENPWVWVYEFEVVK